VTIRTNYSVGRPSVGALAWTVKTSVSVVSCSSNVTITALNIIRTDLVCAKAIGTKYNREMQDSESKPLGCY
jgi:hypothetical protein